jgi:cation diffusion facilitator family transporter
LRTFVRFIARKWIRDWEDGRDPEVRNRYGSMEGWVSIVVNLVLFVVKGLFGILTGSVALIADSFHTLSDVLTSVVIVASFRMAKKPSDASHPFGHGRMEAIASVVVAVLLTVVGVEIFKSSVDRILHPKDFDSSWLVMGVILSTVVIKELLARFSRELGRMIESTALEADFWHHRSDAISSILVVLAFLGQHFGFPHLDGPAGIVVAVMIAYAGWEIARKGIDDLLGANPSDDLVQRVKSAVREFPDVLDVHDLIVHQYGQEMVLSFHIEISDEHSLKYGHALADRVQKTINEKFRTHTTVHLDPIDMRDPELLSVRHFLGEWLDKYKERVSFHDIRLIVEDGGKQVFLDLVIDPKLKDREIKALENALRDALIEAFPGITDVVVEVEPKYAV